MTADRGARRVLIAGIGNIFLGDDAFGVEVVRRLAPASLPPSVDAVDYGIRGVHLAYELMDRGYDTLIIVDTLPTGGPPGTVALLDVGAGAPAPSTDEVPVSRPIDGHGMTPDAVLSVLRNLGGSVDRVLVVGCQPAVLDEGMGLSEPVAAAVEGATHLVADLAIREAGRAEAVAPTTQGGG